MATQDTKYEIPGEMRDFAERSVDQAKKAFDGFVGAAQKAVETLDGSTSSLHASATDATRRTLSYAEQNIAAAFEHAQKLVRAKDMQEAIQLQTEFTRTQFASFQSQLRELGEVAQNAARTASSHAASAANQAAETARGATQQAANAFDKTSNS